jgi:excisionase family DNA binding protein
MKTVSLPAATRLTAPDLEEARQAREAARLFASMAATARRSQSLRLIPDNKASQPVEVPEVAFRMFLEILNQMAQGNAVTLVPTHHELTTQQAANLLRVSRPYFVKLLETGAIQHHRVGSRRRVKFEHLMGYLEKVKGESREALDQLAAQAQELNMGY